jgi:hypothetical protein
MTWMTRRLSVPALAAALLGGGVVGAAEEPKSAKDVLSFGNLQAPTAEAARQRAQEWLKSAGKTDAASQAAFNKIWDSDRPLLDKVADTFVLGDPRAAALMAEARDTRASAPEKVPGVLKDTKTDPYLRSNLALAYAKALADRKVYEEAREALTVVKPEQVVDPASYFFTKALCEYTLMMKKDADDSIARLLEDVSDAPERYRMVAALMHFDMLTWQDKDLGWVSRKMGVIRDRLELDRAGKKTQQIQKEVLVRLDEMIKELENKQKQQGQGQGQGGGNGGQCPEGGQSGPPNGSIPNGTPAADSALPSGQKEGVAEAKKLAELTKAWGDLPEKERARAMTELTRNMPPRHKEAIEAYFDKLQKSRDEK